MHGDEKSSMNGHWTIRDNPILSVNMVGLGGILIINIPNLGFIERGLKHVKSFMKDSKIMQRPHG